jgi:hypothetical protein
VTLNFPALPYVQVQVARHTAPMILLMPSLAKLKNKNFRKKLAFGAQVVMVFASADL